MGSKGLHWLVAVEVIVLGLVAMLIFAFLASQYQSAMAVIANRTAVAQETEVFIALLTASPPTHTPTNTPPPTLTPTKANTPTATQSPLPTPSPLPVASSTPRALNVIISKCDTIDDPGTYRLSTDLSVVGDCIKIETSYTILDCAGHAIRGANFLGSGIAVRRYGLFGVQIPSYVEIRNCHISNFRYGIWVEAGKYLAIHDNDSSNNYDDTDLATHYGIFLGNVDGGGIRLNSTSDSHILSNTTTHQAIGIDLRSSTNIVVRGNTSSGNSAWGVNLARTQNSEVVGNTMADNIRRCTWGAGAVDFGCDAGGVVIQDGSSGNLISNNMVMGRNGNGIFIKAHAQPCGDNNSIVGNTISSVLYNAVELGFCSGNKVNNNNIRGGLDGIWMGFAHDNEIRNNTISNMNNHGIISSNSRNNMVSGNQIISSNVGLFFYSDNYDPTSYFFLRPGDYRSHDNCLCGNTFLSNSVAIQLKDSTNNQVTNNTFQSNARTILFQGNTEGNNLQGNTGWLFPPVVEKLAWLLPNFHKIW